MISIKQKSKRKAGLLIGSSLLLSAALLLAWDNKLTVTTYSLSTDKLTKPLRILLLSDLHSCVYGEGQRELLDQVEALSPDLILLAGDMLDDEMPHQPGKLVLRVLGAAYPCFYVPGNHEHLTGELDSLLKFIKDCGIVVPTGACALITIQGQRLQVCGMDDPIFLGRDAVLSQAEEAKQTVDPTLYTILLSHRPEQLTALRPLGFDLIVAGHAHGGQWRLPGGKNGLYAPHQGLFPSYSGGIYSLGETTGIVSRGLARESTRVPRLCNPPELVLISLTPREETF